MPNADGSFKFDFALSSLDVHDLVTQSTLFSHGSSEPCQFIIEGLGVEIR